MAHTPGPWYVDEALPGGLPHVYARSHRGFSLDFIADASGPNSRAHEVSIANARLIAAAPDMLVALEYAEAQLAYSDEDAHLIDTDRADALRLVQAAIAAAGS